jgi:hypothetical protein
MTVTTPEQRFELLAGNFTDSSEINLATGADRYGAGSDTLSVNGAIFAMLIRDHLVVKLPATRVAALIEVGDGKSFDAGEGRPMREWLVVKRTDDESWLELTREALAFVAARTG